MNEVDTMRLIKAILALILAFCFFSSRSTAQSDPAADQAEQFRKGEVIVELKPGASISAVNTRNRTTTVQWIYGTNFYRLRTPGGKKEKKYRRRLAKDPDVLSASLNPVVVNPSVFARSTQSFPEGFPRTGLRLEDFYSQQGLFEFLSLEEVALRSRGNGVVVAVIDTGIDRTHPLIAGRLWRDNRAQGDLEGDGVDNDSDGLTDDSRGWDFIDGDNDPTENYDDPQTTVAGHGTFIAGLISLLAPDCRILPVRAFPEDGIGDAFTVAAAVKYAADHGARVINLSMGSPEVSELLDAAIEDARQRGIFLVAAVGNENDERTPQFPSSDEGVMAVAAIDLEGRKTHFSNFGPHVDVCAPGSRLISTYPGEQGGSYAGWSGTSFAAPFAAAEAALLLAVDPKNPDVKSVIEETARDIGPMNPGFNGKLGRGSIDPLAALRSMNISLTPRPISDYHVGIELIRGPASTEARGVAAVNVTGSQQNFIVDTGGLSVRTTYNLVVDGNLIVANALASNLGTLRFAFSTAAGQTPLPPPLNPVTNIRRVELRDALGRVVLQGDLKSDSPTDSAKRFQEKETRLISPTSPGQLGGKAGVKIEGERQELRLEAEGLAPAISFQMVVDGVVLKSFVAQSGFMRAVFTNYGEGGVLPPSLKPVTNIRRVEVHDGRGQIVLVGEFRSNLTTITQIR
jgi:hypothetical protein